MNVLRVSSRTVPRAICGVHRRTLGTVFYDTSNNDDPGRIQFDSVSPRVFVANGLNFFGHVIALPHMVMMWRPLLSTDSPKPELAHVSDNYALTPDAFTLFKYISPRPEMVLFGGGDYSNHPSPEVKKLFRDLGIAFEVTSTVNYLLLRIFNY
jgi:uncharacterized protein